MNKKSFLNKLIYLLGSKLRNPTLNIAYNSLKSTEFASESELKDLQNKKLEELAAFCYQYSDYYKSIFDTINVNPTKKPFGIEQLQKLPILEKSTLISKNKELHTLNKFDFKKVFYCETSGSTGQALTFYRNEEWDSFNRASIERGLSWYGVFPWDKNGYFWGFNFSKAKVLKTKLLDFLVNRFRLFSYSSKELDLFLNKCKKAQYVEGYSSMIYEVAKLANEKKISITNLKLVKGTSEKIYPYFHKETLKAFGCKIVSEYGSAESGIIAFECPAGNMHLNEETCYVECIDGQAVVTNLVARSFPTLRYALGDYIELSDGKCVCGRQHRILKEVTGRIGKNLIGISNKKFPSLTLYYVFKNLAVNFNIELTYRCEQRAIGKLDVFLECSPNPAVQKLLINEFQKYFSGDMEFQFNYVDSIQVKGKKMKDFESYLD